MTGTTSIGMLYHLKDIYSILLSIQQAVYQLYSGQGGPTCITTIDCHRKIMEIYQIGTKKDIFIVKGAWHPLSMPTNSTEVVLYISSSEGLKDDPVHSSMSSANKQDETLCQTVLVQHIVKLVTLP
jgi:hypothetical protein